MTELEIKRIQVEISKVKSGIDEMEYKILERELDIKRLKDNIEISNKRILELKNKLQGSEQCQTLS